MGLKKSKVRPKAYVRLDTSIKNLKTYFTGVQLTTISEKQIEEYMGHRLTTKVEKIRLPGPATVNRELACLRNMFELAIKYRLANKNPVKRVEFYKETRHDYKILNRNETSELIKAAPAYLKSIIILTLQTGIRKEKLLDLKWEDIEDGFIHVKDAKGGKSRRIPLSSVAQQALAGITQISEYVFTNPKTGTRFQDIKRSFRKACGDAEIEGFRFHDLRHTAATYLVQGGTDLATACEILGHSDINVTKRYLHPTDDVKRKAVEILAEVFDSRIVQLETSRIQEDLTPKANRTELIN